MIRAVASLLALLGFLALLPAGSVIVTAAEEASRPLAATSGDPVQRRADPGAPLRVDPRADPRAGAGERTAEPGGDAGLLVQAAPITPADARRPAPITRTEAVPRPACTPVGARAPPGRDVQA